MAGTCKLVAKLPEFREVQPTALPTGGRRAARPRFPESACQPSSTSRAEIDGVEAGAAHGTDRGQERSAEGHGIVHLGTAAWLHWHHLLLHKGGPTPQRHQPY